MGGRGGAETNIGDIGGRTGALAEGREGVRASAFVPPLRDYGVTSEGSSAFGDLTDPTDVLFYGLRLAVRQAKR